MRFVLLGLLLLLSGCAGNHKNQETGKKVRKKKITLPTNIDGALEIVREQEARLSDIPIPLEANPLPYVIDDSLTTEHMMLGYDCSLDHDAVINFYDQEMERNGWQKTAEYKGFETLLNFSKPQRFCSISIRPGLDKKRAKPGKGVGIFIFTGDKKKLL
jgi:hypothetical protein